jgi:hypothetical protein
MIIRNYTPKVKKPVIAGLTRNPKIIVNNYYSIPCDICV